MHLRLRSRIRYGGALVGAAAVIPLAVAPGVSASPAETRQEAYEAAAAEFGVPLPVLLGVSYLQSRWDANAGEPSTVAGYGPMHLTDAEYVLNLPGFDHHNGDDEDPRGDDSRERLLVGPPEVEMPHEPNLQTLEAAAELTGTAEEQLRTDAAANIRGGAALLASYQAELGAPVGADSDPADWFGAVARYSGSDTEDAARVFANEVYSVINQGASRTTDGEVHRHACRTAAPATRAELAERTRPAQARTSGRPGVLSGHLVRVAPGAVRAPRRRDERR
jgi:hypothetical protein